MADVDLNGHVGDENAWTYRRTSGVHLISAHGDLECPVHNWHWCVTVVSYA